MCVCGNGCWGISAETQDVHNDVRLFCTLKLRAIKQTISIGGAKGTGARSGNEVTKGLDCYNACLTCKSYEALVQQLDHKYNTQAYIHTYVHTTQIHYNIHTSTPNTRYVYIFDDTCQIGS